MLRVRLLGPLEADVAGRSVEQPASSRAWELLAWLALHPGEHPRGALAARFWPDVLDASARASLRSAPGRCAAHSVPRVRTSSRPAGTACCGARPISQELDELFAPPSRPPPRCTAGRSSLISTRTGCWRSATRQTARLSAFARLAQGPPRRRSRSGARGGGSSSIRSTRRRPATSWGTTPPTATARRRWPCTTGWPSVCGRSWGLRRRRRRAPPPRGCAARRPRREASGPAGHRPRRRARGARRGMRSGVGAWRARRGGDRQDAAGARGARARTGRRAPGPRRARRWSSAGLRPTPWVELLRDLADELVPPPPDATWPDDLAVSHRHCRGGSVARSAAPPRPRPSTHDRGCSRRRWSRRARGRRPAARPAARRRPPGRHTEARAPGVRRAAVRGVCGSCASSPAARRRSAPMSTRCCAPTSAAAAAAGARRPAAAAR